MFSAIRSSLLLTLATSVSTALAQCSLAGYLAAFSTNGTVIGAVARALPFQGILTIDETSIRSNYLGVIGFSTSTLEGDVVLLQILSPIDPSAPYISMVISQTSCGALPIPNGDAAWIAQLVPADGFPLGPFPRPGTTRSTLLGGYGDLQTFCGEPMAFAIRSNLGRDTLAPVWTDQNGNQHSLIVVHDITNNRIAVSPSLASYTAAASGPVKLEEVFFAFVT
ncbi:hypothetical protein C8F04DRAFT_1253802 [Mycena alexandri]|uniref:Uncharacterized protein n=1 Tax=Mycena alexandri TaxID=1745969 RepID=A0AAD6T7J6_9AGAR|nr:hypothetical protein C8F04DRAFT_1253802 [Mycena alexandri]